MNISFRYRLYRMLSYRPPRSRLFSIYRHAYLCSWRTISYT